MKRNQVLTAITAAILFFTSVAFAKDGNGGYDIKVHIEGLKDTALYLGNHYGDKQYVRDTIRLDQNGWGEFKGPDTLPGGIYLVILPNKTYFEILPIEQKFTVETDTLDYVQNMKITGSLENKLFNEHQRFIIKKSQSTQAIRARMETNKNNKDSVEILRKELADADKEVKDYRMKMVAEHPNTFMAKIIRTMAEPEVPEPPRDEKGNITDSTFQFRYFKSHFLENVDFGDERLLRSPIMQSKIKTYTQQLTVPLPDSLIQSIDTIIEKSRANKEVFKYCVATLANFYETSNIMGYDKVFVHIAEKYYLSKDAFWADSTLRAKIIARVQKIKPNILGEFAHDLVMPDTAFKNHRLYDIKTKYTVLAFWDPTCSHCKIEIPKLSAYYDSVKTKGVSIEVFSVGIESDMELWKKYVKEHNLKWVNVSDLYNQTNFRDYYDIYSTPVIYLLDREKHIIAKRLDTEKLRDFIENEEKKAGGGKK
jgi:peroxiredoxin